MRRDLHSLDNDSFDLLVVGGGIHGVCVARDAALRGLKVALIERDDFGAATSHNSLKLIHGGFRYLQHLDLRRVRQSLLERRYWLWAAPHLVQPLKFVMPLYGHTTRGPEALWAATQLYQLLGLDRNRELLPERRLPAGGVVSRAACQQLIPGVDPDGLSGGAYWYDGQMLDADRLLLECLVDASAHGAVLANHVEAQGFLGDGRTVGGVRALDRLDGHELEIRARLTINTCGPWIDKLLRQGLDTRREGMTGLSKCMNLVTRRLTTGHGFAVRSSRASDALLGRTRRMFFFTPWWDRTVVGTSHLPYSGDPDDCRFSEEDIAEFLGEINAALPDAKLSLDDIHYCYGGLTPAEEEETRRGEVARSRQSEIVDHQRSHGINGLLSAVGVKWTTARLVAEKVLDLASTRLGGIPSPCPVVNTPLPGARDYPGEAALQTRAAGQIPDAGAFRSLLAPFGMAYSRILEQGDWQPDEPDSLFRARCRHAVREELALRLGDLVFRRLHTSHLGRLDNAQLRWCAGMMASELGWDAQRTEAELDSVRQDRWWRPGGECASTEAAAPALDLSP